MTILSGRNYDIDTLLLASIADALNILVWFQTKDGQKRRNRPKSFVDAINNVESIQEEQCQSFDTIEEYEKARKAIIERN